MQLYSSNTTPFGRKVMVMILESGLADRVTLHLAAGTPLDPGSMPLDRNPLGKIPALVTDAGETIFDSRVICRYLDTQSNQKFYPTGAGLWPVLTLEAMADGMIEAAVLMVYEARLRPEEKRFAPWVEGQWSKIARALDAIEATSLPLLNGPLTAAHIALGCALNYLDFRHPDRHWRQTRPSLATWQSTFDSRPSMQQTQPK